jgi:hypothetical protein
MTDYIPEFGKFLFTALCAGLAIVCEATAQAASFASHKLLCLSDELWEFALQLNPEPRAEIENAPDQKPELLDPLL